MKVLEQFSLPKRGQGEANGDALYVGQDYVAVIDGATPKDSRTWDSMPADAFVAGCLARGMERLSAVNVKNFFLGRDCGGNPGPNRDRSSSTCSAKIRGGSR